MLTNIATTSADAYHGLRRDGSLTREQAQIMAVIEHGRDYSGREIARLAGLDTSTVAGRLFDLCAAGALDVAPQRACSISGRTVNPVRRPAGPAQRGLFA